MYFLKQIQPKTMTFKLYQTRYKITTKKTLEYILHDYIWPWMSLTMLMIHVGNKYKEVDWTDLNNCNNPDTNTIQSLITVMNLTRTSILTYYCTYLLSQTRDTRPHPLLATGTRHLPREWEKHITTIYITMANTNIGQWIHCTP